MHHWIVYCFDWNTGDVLWEKTVHKGKPAEPVHIKNTYASETPITDGERVYFYFGNLGVFCFDLNGKEVWQKRLDPVKIRYDWGTAASPVLQENKLFVVAFMCFDCGSYDVVVLFLDKIANGEGGLST